MVMIAFLSAARRCLCASSAGARLMLETTSPAVVDEQGAGQVGRTGARESRGKGMQYSRPGREACVAVPAAGAQPAAEMAATRAELPHFASTAVCSSQLLNNRAFTSHLALRSCTISSICSLPGTPRPSAPLPCALTHLPPAQSPPSPGPSGPAGEVLPQQIGNWWTQQCEPAHTRWRQPPLPFSPSCG